MTEVLHAAGRLSVLALPLLLTVFLRVCILLGISFVAATLLRRAPASTRHLLWLIAFGGAFLVLLLSLSGPFLRLDLAAGTGAPRAAADAVLKVEALSTALGVPSAAARGDAVAATPGNLLADWRMVGQAAAGLLWFAGAVAGMLRLLYGRLILRRLVCGGEEVDADGLLQDLCRQVGLRRRAVRAVQSPLCTTPLTCGFVRPVILLPPVVRRWPPADRRAVLLHEVLHAKRADSLSRAVAFGTCALLWFVPPIWAAYRRLCLEQEKACDAAVVGSGVARHSYAACVLEAARICRGPALEVGFSFLERRARTLKDRLYAILDRRRVAPGGWALLAITAFALSALTASGAVGSRPLSLFDAARRGTAEQVRAALFNGAAVNARAPGNGLTPLMVAAWHNPDPDVLRALLDAGAEMEARDYFGGLTAVAYAAQNSSNPEVFQLLRERGAVLSGIAVDGDSLLLEAAWRNPHPRILAPIFAAGARIDETNNDGMTALMMAAQYGNAPMIPALLDAGASARLRSKSGLTAYEMMDAKLRGTQIAALLEAACR